jgi:hypothetical protein
LTDELELLVDATVAAGFKKLELSECGLTPAAAPALARLLSSPALTSLHIVHSNVNDTMLDAAGCALLANALRGNCVLRELVLRGLVWRHFAAEVPVLFHALTGHASLRRLVCSNNHIGADADSDAAAEVFGHALGALVAADAPALEEMQISFQRRGTDAVGPLVDELPRNTHLRDLVLYSRNLSPAFAEQRLLPAVRSNTSLRRLYIHDDESLNLLHCTSTQAISNARCPRPGPHRPLTAPGPHRPSFVHDQYDAATTDVEAVWLVHVREAARMAAEADAAAGNA